MLVLRSLTVIAIAALPASAQLGTLVQGLSSNCSSSAVSLLSSSFVSPRRRRDRSHATVHVKHARSSALTCTRLSCISCSVTLRWIDCPRTCSDNDHERHHSL